MSYEHHGHARIDKRSPEYQCWLDIKQRCLNPASQSYAYYGGRGIMICDYWRDSFAAFLADMGPRPEGMTIDRIDNDGNYEPGNCRWASRGVQIGNRAVTRRVVVDGEELSLTEACSRLGLNRKMVASRIDRGVDPQIALSPIKAKHLRKRAA